MYLKPFKLWRKKVKTFVLIVTGFIIFPFLFTGCTNSNAKTIDEKEKSLVCVNVFEVKDPVNKTDFSYPGVIKPLDEVKLSFRTGGPITLFYPEVGKKFEKNQIIAKMDKRDYLVKIENIKARLLAAKAGYVEKKLKYNRYLELFKKNAVSRADYDFIKAAYENSASLVKALEKELEASENSLKDTVLKAPFTGFVSAVFSENHEFVQPGQPVVSLINLESIEIEALIPENILSSSKKFCDFKFILLSDNTTSKKAQLKEIGKKGSGFGNTYPLILKADNPGYSIKPGMSALVEFSVKDESDLKKFEIPMSSIIKKDNQKPFVWKIEDNLPLKIIVELEKFSDSKNIVISGNLNKGDKIAHLGAHFILENRPVSIVEKKSQTNVGNEL
jgi:RND family efflux transporter MFP subunit